MVYRAILAYYNCVGDTINITYTYVSTTDYYRKGRPYRLFTGEGSRAVLRFDLPDHFNRVSFSVSHCGTTSNGKVDIHINGHTVVSGYHPPRDNFKRETFQLEAGARKLGVNELNFRLAAGSPGVYWLSDITIEAHLSEKAPVVHIQHAKGPNKVESWIHLFTGFIPVLSEVEDVAASGYYYLTGNTDEAKKRLKDLAVDTAIDVATAGVGHLIARGVTVAGRELVHLAANEAAHGAAEEAGRMVADEAVHGNTPRSSIASSMDYDLEADTLAVSPPDPQFRTEAVHGAPRPILTDAEISSRINRGGLYKDLKTSAYQNCVERNHVPPVSTYNTSATSHLNVGGRGEQLPAVTTTYAEHQRTAMNIFGTTGRSSAAQDVRAVIKQDMEKGNFVSAIKRSILADYEFHMQSEEYEKGLKEMVDGHVQIKSITRTEGANIKRWITERVAWLKGIKALDDTEKLLAEIEKRQEDIYNDVLNEGTL